MDDREGPGGQSCQALNTLSATSTGGNGGSSKDSPCTSHFLSADRNANFPVPPEVLIQTNRISRSGSGHRGPAPGS